MTPLLYGRERFLKDEALAQLKARLFRNPSELGLNFQAFDAEEHPLSAVLDFLGTAPFLAEKRLAVLRRVETLSEKDGKRLLEALGTLPSTASLLLDTDETNTKKNALIRALAEKTRATACHVPFEENLPGWVETRAKSKGLTLERGASATLIRRIGADLAALDGALETVRFYVHPRRSASAQDVDAVTPLNPEEDVFRLAECLLEGKKKEALTVVDGLYRSGTKAPEIVGALAGQIERFKKALSLLESGRSPADVGEEMRVPRMHQAEFIRRLRQTSASRLKGLQKALLACDESYKTGLAEERVSIEKFVLTV